MFCKKCGNEIADGARFCKFCGSPVEAENSGETTVLGGQTPPVSNAGGETTVLGGQETTVLGGQETTVLNVQATAVPGGQNAPVNNGANTPGFTAGGEVTYSNGTVMHVDGYVGGANANTPVPEPAKKKNGKVIGIVIGVVVAVIAVIAIVVGVLLGGSSNDSGSLGGDNSGMAVSDAEKGEEWVLVSKKTYQGDSISEEYNFEYDSSGRIVSQKGADCYYGDFSTSDYIYDENGNILSETKSYSCGAVETCTREFDSKGNCVHEIISLADTDGFTYVTDSKSEYNENGKCITMYQEDYRSYYGQEPAEGESSSSKHSYEYDEHGNKISFKILASFDGEEYYESNAGKSFLTYDTKGNCIQEKKTDSDGHSYIYMYEYDENGNKIKELAYEAFEENYDDYDEGSWINIDDVEYILDYTTIYEYAKLKDVAQ